MKIGVLLLAILAFGIKVNAQEIEDSRFAEDAPKIDGVFNEWHREMRFFDADAKVSYDMGNDKENLYLVFQATDFAVQRLLARGMTININTEGKKRDGAFLQYPFYAKADTVHKMPPQENGEMQRHHFPKQFSIAGFTQLADGILTTDSSMQIRLASTMLANKAYTVEMAIPLKNLGITADLKKPIALNLRFTADKTNRGGGMPSNGAQGGGRGMQGGMGRGGMMGGGMRGMGNGGGIPRNGFADEQSLKTNLWIKFTLAKPEAQ